MQAQTNPISINSASTANAAPAPSRGAAADSAAEVGTPFAAALAREIGQRQQAGDAAAAVAVAPSQDALIAAPGVPAVPLRDAAAEAADAALAAEAATVEVTDMLALAASIAPAPVITEKMGTDPISASGKMGTDPISASGKMGTDPISASGKMGTDPILGSEKMGSVPILGSEKMGSVPILGSDPILESRKKGAGPDLVETTDARTASAGPVSPASAVFAQAIGQAVQATAPVAAPRTEPDGASPLRSMFATAVAQVSQETAVTSTTGAAAPAAEPLADVAVPPTVARAPAQSPQAAPAQVAGLPADLAALAGEAAAEPAPAEAPAQNASFATQLQAARTEQVQASAMAGGERLAARVGTPAWDKQLGQKIVFMAAGAEQSASLILNPPDLGPVQVVLNITNDQASVAFSSAQLEVRQALENAMPKLREMMGESGITLGNATVNAGMPEQQQQAQRGQDARSGGHHGNGRGNGSGTHGDDAAPAAPVRRVSNGVVDTFA